VPSDAPGGFSRILADVKQLPVGGERVFRFPPGVMLYRAATFLACWWEFAAGEEPKNGQQYCGEAE
jgi:hypothetical protein